MYMHLRTVVYIANFAFLAVILPLDSSFKFFMIGGIATAIMILIWIMSRLYPQHFDKSEIPPPKEPSITNPLLILSGIYAVLAGFGLTEAFSNTSKLIESKAAYEIMVVDIVYKILPLLTYLSLAIPFYHGATMAFLKQAERWWLRKQRTEKPRIAFLDFLVLFVEAGVLYFMSTNLDEFSDIVKWAFILMVADTTWILATRNSKDRQIPREWLQLNIPYSAFLIIAFALFSPDLGYTGKLPDYALPFLFSVTLFRTVVDYGVTWKSIYFGN